MAMMKSEGVIYSELISPPLRSLPKMDTKEKGRNLKEARDLWAVFRRILKITVNIFVLSTPAQDSQTRKPYTSTDKLAIVCVCEFVNF